MNQLNISNKNIKELLQQLYNEDEMLYNEVFSLIQNQQKYKLLEELLEILPFVFGKIAFNLKITDESEIKKYLKYIQLQDHSFTKIINIYIKYVKLNNINSGLNNDDLQIRNLQLLEFLK